METDVAQRSGQKVRNRRRKYTVNPRFQWRYAGTIAGIVFFASSILSSLLYLFLFDQTRARFINPEAQAVNAGGVVLVTAIAYGALMAAGIGLWSVLFTHRICGPLFLLDRYFTQLAAGQLPTPRSLRKKDEFKELFRNFSTAMESLRMHKQRELDALTHALGSATAANDGDLEACKQALDDVVEQLEPFRQAAADALGAERQSPPTSENFQESSSMLTSVSV